MRLYNKIRFYTFRPSGTLAEIVRFFWVLEGNATPSRPYYYRSTADGCPELVFHYQGTLRQLAKDRPEPFGVLHGPARKYHDFIADTDFLLFGAYLYPYAIPYLFGLPTHELSDQMPVLTELPGSEWLALEEALCQSTSHADMIRVLSSFLEKKIKISQSTPAPAAIRHHIRQLIQQTYQAPISQLARESNLSVRHFERLFKAHAGFPASTFVRLSRFQSVLQTPQVPASGTFTELALAHGYYDQAHFNREFREFSGYSPRQFFEGTLA